QDVIGLITIAGDLNHDALSKDHGTTPLNGSLNPISVASKLKKLPQQHWSGSNDKIVPPWVAEQFIKQEGFPNCAKHFTLKGVKHHKGWLKHWPEMLHTPLNCSQTQ
ncbi:MAG: alpha/beta hydrolase, partial [Candidatus Berkiellales bacterium]